MTGATINSHSAMTKYRVTHNGEKHTVYHTSRDCQYIQTDVIEISDEQVTRMGLRLCSACDPDFDPSRQDQDHSIYQLAREVAHND